MKEIHRQIIVIGVVIIIVAVAAIGLYRPKTNADAAIIAGIEVDIGEGREYEYCYSVGCFTQEGITQFREALETKIETDIVGKDVVKLFKEISPTSYEKKRLEGIENVKKKKAKLRETRFFRNTAGIKFEELGCERLVFESPNLGSPDLEVIRLLESDPQPQYFIIRDKQGEAIDAFIGCK